MSELENDLYYIEAEELAKDSQRANDLSRGIQELQENNGLIWIDNLIEYLERLELLTPELENAINDFINRPYSKKADLCYYSDSLFDIL